MPVPVASFRFVTNGLQVFFDDQSTETPTSWLWDFDEAPTQVVENPTHIYSAAGTYTITLISTNGSGDSVPYSFNITVSADNSILIADIIAFEMPPSILVNPARENYLLRKWRLYLQAAFGIEDAYLDDEANYTQLQNILLAKLVVYDTIIIEAQAYMASNINSSTIAGSGGGNIKKIETGPGSAEWYSGSETLKDMFDPGRGADGISAFDKLMADICGIANHNTIMVKLPMCKLRGVKPIVPGKTDVVTYLSTEDYLTKYYGTG